MRPNAEYPRKALRRALNRIEQGWSPSCENQPADDEGWGVLKVGCVNGSIFDPSENKALPPEVAPLPELEIRSGDVLVSRANTRDLLGSMAVVEAVRPRLLLCDKLYRLSLRSEQYYPKFLLYVFQARCTRDQIEAAATGASQSMQNIGQDSIRNLLLPQPPRTVQCTIADFLDRKITVIDALIAKKERLIELLREKRQALIMQAVTKGLDSNVPMKESGIDRIGQVPRHWSVLELRRRWTVTDCKHRTPTYVDEGFPLVSTTEVKPGRLRLDGVSRRVGEADYLDMIGGGRAPKKGDIVYSRNASLGVAAFVDTDEHFCMGQDVVLITSQSQSQLFLAYVLNSPLVTGQVEAQGIGSTFKRINVPDIRQLRVPAPPPNEQRAIGEQLDAATSHLDRIEHSLRTQLGRMHEYRQALITAAVTGKIDVFSREAA